MVMDWLGELWPVIVIGLLVGLDNLQVGAALGLAGMSSSRRRLAALAFAFCETLMPLLGLTLGRTARQLAGDFGEWIGIVALCICGFAILGAARWGEARCEGEGAGLERTATLFVLPVSLSFDNLLAGISFGALGFPVVVTALIIGGLSGLLCALGLYSGHRAHRLVPAWAESAGGALLLVLAALQLAEALSTGAT